MAYKSFAYDALIRNSSNIYVNLRVLFVVNLYFCGFNLNLFNMYPRKTKFLSWSVSFYLEA